MSWPCWRDASHEVKPHPTFGWPQCTVCQAAPPYHERPNYLPDDLSLDVFIPAGGAALAQLALGTAVVGLSSRMDGYVETYYEGWIYGAAQYEGLSPRGKWEAGLEHAADRMVTAYPTSAMAHFPAHTLFKVGTYNPKTRQVTMTHTPALSTWLGIQTGIETTGVTMEESAAETRTRVRREALGVGPASADEGAT